jgi:hypothetical protein
VTLGDRFETTDRKLIKLRRRPEPARTMASPAVLGMIRHLVYQGVALGRQWVSAV